MGGQHGLHYRLSSMVAGCLTDRLQGEGRGDREGTIQKEEKGSGEGLKTRCPHGLRRGKWFEEGGPVSFVINGRCRTEKLKNGAEK